MAILPVGRPFRSALSGVIPPHGSSRDASHRIAEHGSAARESCIGTRGPRLQQDAEWHGPDWRLHAPPAMAILVALYAVLLLASFVFGGVGALPLVLGLTVLFAGAALLSRGVRSR
jgi:hypothetical protein